MIRRLKSVEGHVRGVEKMVEEGDVTYADIVQQTNAIFSAIRRINTVLLKDFVEERAERDGASEEMINDLIKGHRQGDEVRGMKRLRPETLLFVLLGTVPSSWLVPAWPLFS